MDGCLASRCPLHSSRVPQDPITDKGKRSKKGRLTLHQLDKAGAKVRSRQDKAVLVALVHLDVESAAHTISTV